MRNSIDGQEVTETLDLGINTEELNKEEMDILVRNNPELNDGKNTLEMSSLQEANVDQKSNKIGSKKNSSSLITEVETNKIKSKLMAEIEEKDKILELLNTANSDLQDKIFKATTEYDSIMKRLKQKSSEEDESTITLKIKEIEKEIFASNSEIDNYKKSIDNLKNKIEFKINLERAMNLENILKQETLKNKEIKRELESLSRVNIVQNKALNSYDKENRITEKIDILKSEIKITKGSLKDYQEKFTKQDKFLKSVHEKLSQLENLTKKLQIPKKEIKKSFNKEDLKTLLDVLNHYKQLIKENKISLKNLTRQNEEKLNSYVILNKRIESDFKENDKMNKMLIFKKNELRRIVKTNNNIENRVEKIDNKNTKKILQQNGDITHLFPNKLGKSVDFNNAADEIVKEIENSRLDIHLNNKYEGQNLITYSTDETKPKLFSKNPNRQIIESELTPVIQDGEYKNYNNYDQDLEEEQQFSEEEGNIEHINDSNLDEEGYIDQPQTIETNEYIENEMRGNHQENQVENFNIELA